MVAATARQRADDDRAGDHHRLCVVTRAERPVEDLIRFVAAPDGTLTPDLGRKLPGRGVWVTADRTTLSAALSSKAFARSLKRPIQVPADFAEMIEQLLAKRAIEALALANKAGAAVSGFDKVWETVSKGNAALLVHGSEAAADGRTRLDRKFQAVEADKGRTAPIVTELSIEQLSLAMGRSNVVHAALIHGGVTDKFTREATRLARYRSGVSLPVLTHDIAEASAESAALIEQVERKTHE